MHAVQPVDCLHDCPGNKGYKELLRGLDSRCKNHDPPKLLW
jgi:hypothetical protein